MLLVNGALAAWNGLLAATGKFWCECVRGGICCGGECRCDAGECCGDTWHPDSDPNEPCGENQIYLRWGANDGCCGCVGEQIYDGRVPGYVSIEDVVDDLCCPACEGPLLPYTETEGSIPGTADPLDGSAPTVPAGTYRGCLSRCCVDGECSDLFEAACFVLGGTRLAECCQSRNCPASCCSESASGTVSCEPNIEQFLCNPPSVIDSAPCESACTGACCIDGTDLHENSPMTQAECDDLGGFFMGIGSAECPANSNVCRAPFDANCCERVVSSAARLTFTGPRKRRFPEFSGCGFEVTINVKTSQPVYVHGLQFGNPYETCDETSSFRLCNDQFHVTPAPCQGNLSNLEIDVCWEQASGPETLRFTCCQNTTHLLSNCDCECVTNLVYEGSGCTSNAVLKIGGNSSVISSGVGPLVLTSSTVQDKTCNRTLTLTGTNTDANEIPTPNNPSGGTLQLVKSGVGCWQLSGAGNYDGGLLAQAGTLRIASAVSTSGNSPFGSQSSPLPEVSGTSSLLASGVSIDREFVVQPGAGTVVIGGNGTFSANILLGKNVTLAADDSATVTFSGGFRDENNGASPAVAFTIGTPTLDGTVVFDSVLTLPASITSVSIEHGTLVVNQIISGPAIVASSTFTSSTLTVDFLSPPAQGDTFRLLPGVTEQSYTPVLTNAGGATGTYDSATSTLTID